MKKTTRRARGMESSLSLTGMVGSKKETWTNGPAEDGDHLSQCFS